MQHLRDELQHFGEVAASKAKGLGSNISQLWHSDGVHSIMARLTPRQRNAGEDVSARGVAETTEALAAPAKEAVVAAEKDTDAVKDQDQPAADKELNRSSTTVVATPDQAVAALMAGHQRFLEGHSIHPHQTIEHLRRLCDSQKPFAAILGCADSRVPPEMLFDVGFGDLFVCRVAGNLSSSEQVASLEYAVAHLHIKLIMVLGHAKCGACAAALADIRGENKEHELEGHLDVLVDGLAVAVERGLHHDHLHTDNLLDDVVKENVIYQVERLSKAPVIKRALAAKKISIVGGYYDIDTFKVSLLSA